MNIQKNYLNCFSLRNIVVFLCFTALFISYELSGNTEIKRTYGEKNLKVGWSIIFIHMNI